MSDCTIIFHLYGRKYQKGIHLHNELLTTKSPSQFWACNVTDSSVYKTLCHYGQYIERFLFLSLEFKIYRKRQDSYLFLYLCKIYIHVDC